MAQYDDFLYDDFPFADTHPDRLATIASLFGMTPARPERCRLLELGCGMGRTATHFGDHFGRVDAVDVSARMVERARGLCMPQNVHFHVSDGTTLQPFENGSMDAVFSFLVLQHVPSEQVLRGLMHEIARVLAQGGRAALQFDTRPASLLGDLYKAVPDPLLPRKHRRYMRRYRRDPRGVRGWITEAGLVIVKERDPATDTHFFVVSKP